MRNSLNHSRMSNSIFVDSSHGLTITKIFFVLYDLKFRLGSKVKKQILQILTYIHPLIISFFCRFSLVFARRLRPELSGLLGKWCWHRVYLFPCQSLLFL